MFNTKNTTFLILCLVVSCVLVACAGFDIGDLVTVRTPSGISKDTGLPTKMSLNEAEAQFKLWSDEQKTYAAQWRADIEDGNFFVNTLNQITMSALNQYGPALGGIPLMGPLLPLLAGGIGIFMRRPGDANKKDIEAKFAAQLKKEKEASYNAGQDKARAMLTAAK